MPAVKVICQLARNEHSRAKRQRDRCPLCGQRALPHAYPARWLS